MTQPNQQQPDNQGTPPPNAAPPHASQQPPQQQQQQQRPPLVLQQSDTGLQAQVAEMSQRLTALPESIVHAFRESTSGQSAQQPQQATQAQQQATQQQQQQTHDNNREKAGYKGPGKFATWFLGLDK